jgi:hypothetical protein
MALRWCAAGMVEAGKQFGRVNGHLHLRSLRATRWRTSPKPSQPPVMMRSPPQPDDHGPPPKFHVPPDILGGPPDVGVVAELGDLPRGQHPRERLGRESESGPLDSWRRGIRPEMPARHPARLRPGPRTLIMSLNRRRAVGGHAPDGSAVRRGPREADLPPQDGFVSLTRSMAVAGHVDWFTPSACAAVRILCDHYIVISRPEAPAGVSAADARSETALVESR